MTVIHQQIANSVAQTKNTEIVLTFAFFLTVALCHSENMPVNKAKYNFARELRKV
jgi:hypothetical protein